MQENKIKNLIELEEKYKSNEYNGIIRTFNFNDDPNYENNGQSLKYKYLVSSENIMKT